MPYIYMIRCTDNSLYTGITTDMKRRMQEHFCGKRAAAKYTKSRRPAALEMVWETESWSDAAKLEYRIKRLSKLQKEALIRQPEQANETDALRQPENVYVPHPELTLEQERDR